jgi:hypothetical protein
MFSSSGVASRLCGRERGKSLELPPFILYRKTCYTHFFLFILRASRTHSIPKRATGHLENSRFGYRSSQSWMMCFPEAGKAARNWPSSSFGIKHPLLRTPEALAGNKKMAAFLIWNSFQSRCKPCRSALDRAFSSETSRLSSRSENTSATSLLSRKGPPNIGSIATTSCLPSQANSL